MCGRECSTLDGLGIQFETVTDYATTHERHRGGTFGLDTAGCYASKYKIAVEPCCDVFRKMAQGKYNIWENILSGKKENACASAIQHLHNPQLCARNEPTLCTCRSTLIFSLQLITAQSALEMENCKNIVV